VAIDAGTATFSSGTGSKTISLGFTPAWIEIEFGGSTIKHSHGFVYSGFQYVYPDNDSVITNSKCIQVKNTTGTVILEGTWTSFPTNQVVFNITTQTGSVPQMLLKYGN